MSQTPQQVYASQPELRIVTGSFSTEASGNPSTVNGLGYTVVKTTTGTYTITFSNPKQTLVSFTCNLQRPSVDDFTVMPGPYTAPTATANATQVVYTINADPTGVGWAAGDVSDDADSLVHFMAVFAQYSVLG